MFKFGAPGHRMLLETTQSEQQTLSDGTTRTVQNTSSPDVNGHLGLTSRQIQRTIDLLWCETETDTVVFRPGINAGLEESERIQQTERPVTPDGRRTESTLFVRDANGQFQPTETRSQEIRTTGPSESVEEETIQRLDVNGKLTLSERNVTHLFEANGESRMVMETFSRNVSGLILSDNRLVLSQRVRRTTTSAADGGGQTFEEVEARVPGSPNEPLRTVRRAVGTIRRVNAERWRTEQDVFVLDEPNARLLLTVKETGEATGK